MDDKAGYVSKDRNRGFTLVELAVVLLIFGVLMTALVPVYSLYIKNQAEITTRTNLDIIESKLADFRGIHGRYPCPAPPSATRDSDVYGHESTECALDVGAKTITVGTCVAPSPVSATSGICVEGSPRLTTGQPDIIVGGLPFRVLDLDETQVVDGYGHQFTYAVTQQLANSDTFQPWGGGLRVIDPSGNSLGTADDPLTPMEDESASSHFIVLSHGENGYGAYNLYGKRQDCGSASALEKENCVDAGGNGVFRLAAKSSNFGSASEYDDLGFSFLPEDVPYWEYTGGAGQDDINMLNSSGKMGMLKPNPYVNATEEEVDVGTDVFTGTVRSKDKIASSSLCTYGSSPDCFEADKIAGSGMHCDPGKYLVKVGDGQFYCQEQVDLKCGPDEYLMGVDAFGQIICGPRIVAGCPSVDVNLCPDDPNIVIPAGPDGYITDYIRSANFPGNERRQRFKCNNGTWEAYGGALGVCTCVAGVIGSRPYACGPCMTGTFESAGIRECPSGNITFGHRINDTCACDPVNECSVPYPYTCPSGMVPEDPSNPPRFKRILSCSADGKPGGFGLPVKVPGSGECVCNDLGSETRDKACNTYRAGYTEKPGESGIPEIRRFDCARLTWGLWGLDTSKTSATNYDEAFVRHCQCDTTRAPRTFTKECNDKFGTATERYTGVIPYRNEWDCSLVTPDWGPDIYDGPPSTDDEIKARHCLLILPIVCEWIPDRHTRSGPRADFPGPDLSSSQVNCDCSTESGAVTKCHKSISDGSRAWVYETCECRYR
ncbi:MAG: type II secretion system protein [Rhodospirillales bacterium]|nr:type II secretion system protein [Rhodospirillales bacterium]